MLKRFNIKSFLVFVLLFFFVLSFNLNISSISAETNSPNEFNQAPPGSPPLIIEKEVSKTIVKPGESITVKLTLKNLNTRSVFDVMLTETLLSPIGFHYVGLSSSTLVFNEITGGEERTFYYIIEITNFQERNLTLDAVSVNYYFSQEDGSRTQYTSYSQDITISFVRDSEEDSSPIIDWNLIFLSLLLILYALILILQSAFSKLIGRS